MLLRVGPLVVVCCFLCKVAGGKTRAWHISTGACNGPGDEAAGAIFPILRVFGALRALDRVMTASSARLAGHVGVVVVFTNLVCRTLA